MKNKNVGVIFNSSHVDKILKENSTRVEKKLKSILRERDFGILSEPISYSLLNGGKRLRPGIVLLISKAMDLHDVAWGRQSVEKALRDVDMPCLSIGVTSDILYPAYQQQQIADAFIAAGAPTEFVEVDSPHGHDAFLMETEQMSAPIAAFLNRLG